MLCSFVVASCFAAGAYELSSNNNRGLEMGFYDCPYCKSKIASYVDIGNMLFILKTDKSCPKCKGLVSVNVSFYLLFSAVTLGYVVFAIFISLKIDSEYSGYFWTVAMLALVCGQSFIPKIIHRVFGIELLQGKAPHS